MVYFNRCGSVPGKYQSYPWFPAGEVHCCWNYWQTRQLHPSHSLQTTGNTLFQFSWFWIAFLHDYKVDCNISRGPGRWFYFWSCALWTSLTACCWRASPLWSSCSKAYPVILETSFLRSVHSDLRPWHTRIYTTSHPSVWIWTESLKCRPVFGVYTVQCVLPVSSCILHTDCLPACYLSPLKHEWSILLGLQTQPNKCFGYQNLVPRLQILHSCVDIC